MTFVTVRPESSEQHRSSTVLQAVLWDMDGTLIDSEVEWTRAQSALLERFGLPALTPAVEAQFVGVAIEQAALRFQELGVPLSTDDIASEITDDVARRVAAGVNWRPGVADLLTELQAARIPMAVVTNSSQSIVDAMLTRLPGHGFTAVVTSERVTNPKPHPEPYELAAADLGVTPRFAVAIEDSPTGVASAVSAGCTVLAVPHGVGIAAGDSYHVRPTLAGMGIAELEQLLANPIQ